MKTIGIKLADGSFYPVLEDNTPSEKQLELTTAHNNQTKVMVDLYRSANCTMDDAEYVDSLQIENLVARPNGEADIKFNISLDEDNQLSAKIVDSETGNESNTTITLVSRTLEERLVTDEYGINDTNSNNGSGAAVVGALAAGGLLATAAAMRDKNDDSKEEITEEPVVDTIEEEVPFGDETFVEEPTIEETPAEDTILEENTAEEAATDETVFEETPAEEPEAPAEDTALPDMDFDIPDETVSEETISEDESSLPDMDFDIPEETNSDDTISEDETTLSDMNFDMQDETISEDTELNDMNFDLPEETDTSDNPEMPDDFFNTEDTMKDPTFDSDSPAAAGLNFDGLYDKETEQGTPAQNDADEVKKKTKVPVIICIICAIICIIATVLILFIIPSKYNLLTKKSMKEAAASQIEEPAPQPEPAVEPEPAVPEAKEDEIVIIEKAEEVVPAQPPVAEEKPKDIIYKIKWGDTLWDIADTYYKNPWRYKYIARYNGIKNPDYIISGTKIVIPAE